MVIPYESELTTEEAEVVRRYAEVVDRVGRLAGAVEDGQWGWAQSLAGACDRSLRALGAALAAEPEDAGRASDLADVAVIAARRSPGGRRLHPCGPLDEATVAALVEVAVGGHARGPAPEP